MQIAEPNEIMTGKSADNKGNIFVVDDNPDDLLLITTILHDNGYKTGFSKKGHEAIASIIAEPPELVILDIKLPDMDGFEVCASIKANVKTSAIPVIFLCAEKHIADIQHAFAVGGVDFITKPINAIEVLKRVQIHLENGRLRSQLEYQAIELNFKNDQLQKEILEHKLAAEKLVESFKTLEDNKKASINLSEDLTTEIEQRKKTEELARENEQRFRGFIENASDIVFALSLDGIFTYISPNEPENIGDFASEAIGKSYEHYIHPDDVELCRDFLRQIKLTGDSKTSEDYRVMQVDGTVRWHSSRGSALRDKDGIINGYLGIARDITERKHADEALKLSEEKFRKAFLISPDSVTINRVSDGMYILVNKGFSKFLGYSENDVIGKTSLQLNIWKSPGDREIFVKKLKAKGLIENFEAEFYSKNGEVKYGLMSSAIMDLNGEPHILSVTRDITERNVSEEKIRKIGRHYQALIENAPDGIVLINNNGEFKFVSPSARRIFGYDDTDEFTKLPDELTHPDDLRNVLSELDTITKNPSYRPTIKYRFANKKGEWKWIESTFSNLLADPDVGSIIINFRDITERQMAEAALVESERLLRESQSMAGLGSYVWNISTGLWKSSEVLDEIFGIDADYIRTLEGWVNIVHPDWRDKMAVYVENEVIGKQQKFDMAYKILRHDNGEERWVHGLGEVEKESINNTIKLIGTIKDITEQKHAEDEILKLNAELERRVSQRTAQLEATNRELEAFSYSISHDLRAPLRHISGFIKLFLENKSTQLTEEELGYLTTVTNSAGEMGKLIDALLIFSRLNQAELQKTIIDTNHLLQHTLHFFDPEIKGRNIEIDLGPLHNTFGDVQLLRQVWTNLISNAIKYTCKKDTAKIEIGSYTESNEVIFYVKDNGAGFDMKYADKLFGVFQRLHKPRDFEGIGIGLANVKRIITRHGGRCWAEGKSEKGASFYFSIPGS